MIDDNGGDGAAGVLHIVGLGPGSAALLTPAAADALLSCGAVVGYSGYVDQLPALLGERGAARLREQRVVAMPLGAETERAALAVDLAAGGLSVALISSGDAGVYGMAGPALERLAAIGWDGANPALNIIPGVSAAQAAAAALGAPLMQDFCAISLSDLTTPWDVIEKRLAAAAQADFVIALYNPRSRKRREHIVIAHAVISQYRSPETPVGIVRNAARPDESAAVTTLGELPARFDDIDMFTTLIIGNSASYLHPIGAGGGRIITPRGYGVRQERR